jgi:hypothetical protein
MTISVAHTGQTGAAIARLAKAWQLSRWAPFLLVLVAALLLRGHVVANVDVSWMLTVAEKVLDGERLYVDVIEINPPAAVFLYVPPVAIARALGVRPETVMDVLVLLAACLSIGLAGGILTRARLLDGDGWRLAALTAGILTILPAHTFGDRDPVAVIAFLPALAVYAARSIRAPVPLAHAIVAGLACAATTLIKPHLVLAIMASALATAVCARSWRPLIALEHWIAGALLAAYAVVIAVAFPAFIRDVIPLVAATYVARPFVVLELLLIAFGLWFAALALVWDARRRAVLDPPLCVLLAASFGAAMAFLAQSKGWPYQSFPMLALALLALALSGNAPGATTVGAPPARRLLTKTVAAGVVAVASFCWMNRSFDVSGFVDRVARLNPHPSMLAITADIALGHPLVREVGGVWVGRVCSNWIASGAVMRRNYQALDAASAAVLDRYETLDRAMLAQDIRRARPDIILVEKVNFDWEAWARADPALREQLDGYREADNFMGIAILRRDR